MKIRSYAPEVIADSSGQWCGNALRFPTEEEAQANVKDLERRWMLVTATRVVPSEDPPNYHWSDGRLVAIPAAPVPVRSAPKSRARKAATR